MPAPTDEPPAASPGPTLRQRLQAGYGPDGDWWHLEQSPFPHIYRREEALFAAWTADAEGPTLDLGCGDGRFSLLLPTAAEPLVCCDLSLHMLQQTRARLAAAGRRAHLVQADAAQPPFRDGAFEHIAAMQVLPHLPDETAFFAEMRRLLRPAGDLVVSAGNRGSFADLYERLRALPGRLRRGGLRAAAALFNDPGRHQRLQERGYARCRLGDLLAACRPFAVLARGGAGILRHRLGRCCEWLAALWPFRRHTYLILLHLRRDDQTDADHR
jgi:SAM-dependent methyltransferase